MAGKIQNGDIKTLAELQALGADKEQLPNIDKLYSPKDDEVLNTVWRKNNYAAILDPDANADSTGDYEVGSCWINTATGKIFYCVDNSSGAAIWKQSGSGGGGVLNFILIGSQEDASESDYETSNDAVYGTVGTAFQGTLELSDVDPFRGDISLLYTANATAGLSDNDWIKRNTVVPLGYQRESFLDFSFQYSNEFGDQDVKVKLIAQPSGEVVIDEWLGSYTDASGNAYEYKKRILMAEGVESYDWGFHIINSAAGSEKLKIDDVVLTPEIGYIEQNIIEQKPDSMIQVRELNGYGSVNTNIRRFATIQQNFGDDVLYSDSSTNGASFEILTDGTYHISYTETSNASTYFGITRNGTELSTILPSLSDQSTVLAGAYQAAGGTYENIAWSGKLFKGDIIRPHSSPTGGDAGHKAGASFTISKVGSVSQFPATQNQKVVIPTSNLEMSGLTGKGTGGESNTATFGQIDTLKGDAIIANNTNGSVITIEKAGILHISSSVADTGGTLWAITKNDPDPTNNVDNTPRENVLATEWGSASNTSTCFAWSGEVKAGDIIRIKTGATPVTGDPGRYGLYVLFYEKEVSVNINTVVPQYEDTDSSVKVGISAGRGSTNVNVKRFASVFQNLGNDIEYISDTILGDSFVIQETGTYHISYSDNFTSAANMAISVNSDVLTSGPTGISTQYRLALATSDVAGRSVCVAWAGKLYKGDVVRAQCDAADSSDNNGSTFTISKQANPSVVGIDGKPIEAFIQEEDSVMRHSGPAIIGTGSSINIFSVGNIVENAGSSIEYQKDSVNGDTWTALEDGYYSVSANTIWNAAATNKYHGITKNQSNLTQPIYSVPHSEKLTMTSKPSAVYGGTNCAWSGPLKKGDIIRWGAETSNPLTDINYSTFSISKVGSLKSQVPISEETVDIPTSEIRMERANSRGTGSELRTVKYNNIAQISSDALTIDDTNGTIFTVEKDGILAISASLYTADVVNLTKNATNPASGPATDEILATQNSGGIGYNSAAWKGSVKVGDKIRVNSNANPSDNNWNHITLIHQENKAEISISNLDPQYEDAISMVRLSVANGYGSTNNFIRRFSRLDQKIGDAVEYTDSAIEGAKFLIKESGFYAVSFTDVTGAGAYMSGITKNADPSLNILSVTQGLLAAEEGIAGGYSGNSSWQGYLSAGDILYPHTAGAGSTTSNKTAFTISKMSNHPITALDVTNFVNCEKQKHQGISCSNNTLLNGSDDIQFNPDQLAFKGSSILKLIQESTYSTFVANERCTVDVSLTCNPNVAGYNCYIKLNGTRIGNGNAIASANQPSTASSHLTLERGDVITMGTGVAVVSTEIYLSILAEASAVETLTEIDMGSQRVEYNGYDSKDGSSLVKFANRESNQDGNGDDTDYLISENNSTFTKLTAEKDCYFDVSIGLRVASGDVNNVVWHFNSLGVAIREYRVDSTSTGSTQSTNNIPIRMSKGDYVMVQANGALENTSAGTYFIVKATPLNSKALIQMPKRKVALVKDIKAASVDGGDFLSGAWRIRDLNSLEGDTSFLNVAANQMEFLEDGIYLIKADVPSDRVNQNTAAIYDASNASFKAYGAGFSNSAYAMQTPAHVQAIVSIQAGTLYEIQHQCTTTRNTSGFGVAAAFAPNVYTQVTVEQLSKG